MSKEPRCENNNILTVSSGHQQEKKVSSKRPPHMDSEDPLTRKRRKSNSESSLKTFSNSSLLILSSSDKKTLKDKSQPKTGKVKVESEVIDKKKVSLPPFEDIVDPNDTDMEDNMSSKSEVSYTVSASFYCTVCVKIMMSWLFVVFSSIQIISCYCFGPPWSVLGLLVINLLESKLICCQRFL